MTYLTIFTYIFTNLVYPFWQFAIVDEGYKIADTAIRSSWCYFQRTSNLPFLCSLSCSLLDQHILTSNLVFTMGLKYFTHLKRKMLELCLKILISHLKLRCASIYWASFKTWHNNTFDMIKHAIEVGVEQFGTCAPLVCIAAGCSPAETREMHLVLV